MLADTHAHLDARAFKDDCEDVISRAWAAGLAAIMTVGADVNSSRQAVALARHHPGVYAAVGIHPHEASAAGPHALADLERLSQEAKVVAIGEVGLDFHYSFSPPQVQQQLFMDQLELAGRLGRPVVVHDREAHTDTLGILRDWVGGLEHQCISPPDTRNIGDPVRSIQSDPVTPGERANPRGVLHCFSGDAAMAEEVMALGFCLSFGGPVTFQNAQRLQDLVRQLPLERILLETDCPYLAPHPHRGKRNEPAYVRLVAARIAELKGMTIEEVATTTTLNAARLFGFAAS
jgi:TatD DNase family protein